MQQTDLFGQPQEAAPEQVHPALVLQEHPAEGYRSRTLINAQQADLTVAFAVDFDTAGERLTKSAAAGRYVAVAHATPVSAAVNALCDALKRLPGPAVLNVAGNGLYTFQAKLGMGQSDVNAWLLEVLGGVHQVHKIGRIRSGGQTGADTAGLVAALALGIPALGLYPKGFLRRNTAGKDFTSSASDLERELRDAAAQLQRSAAT